MYLLFRQIPQYTEIKNNDPFGRNDRNVLQIKGGDKDDIIIGTIELEK